MSMNSLQFPFALDTYIYRSRYDVEWFTAQAPAAASMEPLWARLTSSLVPVRAVSVPSDPTRAMDILSEIVIELGSSHAVNCTGGQDVGNKQPRGGRGMGLAEYVAKLSDFDAVLCADFSETTGTKVGKGGKGNGSGRS